MALPLDAPEAGLSGVPPVCSLSVTGSSMAWGDGGLFSAADPRPLLADVGLLDSPDLADTGREPVLPDTGLDAGLADGGLDPEEMDAICFLNN